MDYPGHHSCGAEPPPLLARLANQFQESPACQGGGRKAR